MGRRVSQSSVEREQADREAEHSRQMSQLQQQVAEGSRRLVESDSQARQEMVTLQRDLRTDQATVGKQRDALETERRQIATERRWDSIIGPAISGAALLLACVLPILLCFAVLRSLRSPGHSEEALSEFLVRELTADQPRLLPRVSPSSAIEGPQMLPTEDNGQET